MNADASMERGRFTGNDMISSLLDGSPKLDLAESTFLDLTVEEAAGSKGIEAIRSVSLGYGASNGGQELRSEIARSQGARLEDILIVPGAAFGLFLVAFELARSGDNAVVLVPCFPPARDSLDACGFEVREVKARLEAGFRIDSREIAHRLDRDTRLVSIASPQNPSGISVEPDVVDEILRAMAERSPHAYLLVDETYREASFGTSPPQDSFAGVSRRLITVSSLSKAYGVAGLRVGWLTASDPALQDRLSAAKLSMVISGSMLAETVALGVLRNRDVSMAVRRRHLASALDITARWREREVRRLDWVPPNAGALCAMRLRSDVFDDDAVAAFWQALPSHGVRLAPGRWFGASDRLFRVGFGYPPLGLLPVALRAVSAAMDDALRRRDPVEGE